MKRRILLTLAALLALFAMLGCGSAQNAATGGEGADASGGDSDEKITLTFANRLLETSTDGSVISHRQMIDEFVKENPNVEISEESLQDPTYKTKIKTLAAGHDLPDVFELIGSDAQMFLDNGLLMPLDDILENDPEWKGGFIPSTIENFRVNGQVTGAPMQLLSTSLIYYNEAIFKEVGIDAFPATWPEFIAAVEKLQAGGYIPIAMGNKGNWLAESCILSALGDRYTGTEWFESIMTKGGAKFTDQPFVDALKALQSLSQMGAFNTDLNSIDNAQQRTLYYNGKAAMFFEGNWAISSVTTDAPPEIRDNTHLAILPTVEGGAGKANATSGGAAWSFAINADLEGEKLEAAIALVKKLTGKDHANFAAENNTVAAVVADNYDESKVSPLFKEYLDMVKELEMTPIYDAQLTPAVIETMNNGLQELLVGAVTPEQLAENIQRTYESQ